MSHNRRKFLKNVGCAAMGSTPVLSTLLNLKAINAAAMSNSTVAAAGDYKALVCLCLGGGNDSYNMLMPTTQREYNDYAMVRGADPNRGGLAIAKEDILSLNSLNTGSRTFGLHPSMPRIQDLYHQGKAAFVANVGTLIEPMTVDEFWSQTKRAPLGLLSHSDQLQQWMTALPHERSGIGWGGRIADMINQMNDVPGLSMNISTGSTNIFQTGVENISYVIETPPFYANGEKQEAIRPIFGYQPDNEYNQIRKRAIDNMLDRTYSDIYEDTYINTNRNARDSWLQYRDALAPIDLSTSFEQPTGLYRDLGYQFGWVAKMIAARETLGFKRQTFFINFSGWDHHDELTNAQAGMLSAVDYAIGQFQLAMQELGTEDCVTTFMISDFARTLRSNGNGTDHAWGANMLALGGPINGQRIYGTYPDTLDPRENDRDTGGGIIVPTTSADLYFSELAEWFGVSRSDLGMIFPNLDNFWDYRGGAAPLLGLFG